MAVAAPPRRTGDLRPHLWTKDEYYRMAEMGLFNGVHVELIEGQVIEMSPMSSTHAAVTNRTRRVLEAAFGSGFHARVQQPLDLGERTEPEPDVAIVAGDDLDYVAAHPTTALLIVEVAETSLRYDRHEKASLYARAGIQDYWIINLKDRQLEVHRHPHKEASKPFGHGYRTRTVLKSRDPVSPLAAAPAKIAVRDLFP